MKLHLLMLVWFGKSGDKIIDKFILEKDLKWIPYDQFNNVEYLNEGGFGTIYKAIWTNKNGSKEVALKCLNGLKENDENLNEFLNEWKYHRSCSNSFEIINLYGFTRNTTPLPAKPAKPNAANIPNNVIPNDDIPNDIIPNDDAIPKDATPKVLVKINDIDEELKSNIMEFMNAPIGHNNLNTESHPQANHASCIHNFTSENSDVIVDVTEAVRSEDLSIFRI
ncbi:kinase-like domain-containing protein [Rhizophagus irregularis DAOM 181602=DAOM 197198]|nr:kinase-like domain-containing protein [Rhizophagus irregularis DAOM 181602=DAOM 197198]